MASIKIYILKTSKIPPTMEEYVSVKKLGKSLEIL